jgi:opine dehydrogenase
MERVLETKTIEITGSVEGTASIYRVTTDIGEGVKGAELIFLAVPAYGYKPFMDLMAPHLRRGQVVVMPGGNYGSILLQNKLRNIQISGVIVGDTSACFMGGLLQSPGKIAVSTMKDTLAAAFPAKDNEDLLDLLNPVLDNTVSLCIDAVEASLNNLGATVHGPNMVCNAGALELASMEKRDWHMYPDGMSPAVGKVVAALDRERIATVNAWGYTTKKLIEMMVRRWSMSNKEREEILENPVPEYKLYHTERFRRGGRTINSLESRHMIEDIPFVLVPLTEFARLVQIETPVTDAIITVASALLGKDLHEEGINIKKLGMEGMLMNKLKQFLIHGVK